MTGPDEAAWLSLTGVVDGFRRPEYGTSMHYPDCLGGGCTGCLPKVRAEFLEQPCAPALGVHYASCRCSP